MFCSSSLRLIADEGAAPKFLTTKGVKMELHGTSGARAKLARAKTLCEQLGEDCAEWASAIDLNIRHSRQAAWHVWTIEAVKANPPLALSVQAGEVVYNLRSALDHLVWAMVLANGQQPNDHTYFPIAMKAGNSWSSMKGSYLKGASHDAIDAIERWQPIVRQPATPHADLLAVVNEMCVHDKHRLLMPGVAAVLGRAIRVSINHPSIVPGVEHVPAEQGDLLDLSIDRFLHKARIFDPLNPFATFLGGTAELVEANLLTTVSFQTTGRYRVNVPQNVIGDAVEYVTKVVEDLAGYC